MRPIAQSNRRYDVWQGREFVPSLACSFDDVVVAVEDAVGEPIGAHVLPDVFDGVQFWRFRRQQDDRQVVGNFQLIGGVPTGPVKDQHGMSVFCDRAADLVEMGLHGLGVGKRHGERGAYPAPGADRAEQIGAFITLVGRLPGSRSAPGPLPHQAVFLPDPGFILEPNLDRSALGDMGKMGLQRFAEVFF